MSAYDGEDLSRPKSSHGRHANDTVNEDARPKSSQGRRDDELDDFEKELNTYIEKEEKANEKTDDKMEKGQRESQGSDKKGERQVLTLHSDNEDSELDDYNLTEDQKRALEELDNLKTDLGYPDEDPPEYDVKERLKVLNEELKNDPTPIEKQNDSKVGFSQNLVSLVAPPPDFSDGEEEDKSGKNTQKQKQAEDKVDDKSEAISGGNPSKKSNTGGKKDKVLIEIDGQFQLLDSDDVRARDLGHVMDNDKENEKRKSKVQPMPPVKPRPATATNGSRRNVRTTQARQRPQSAGNMNNKDPLDNFHYNSPYALSPREKQLMEERKKALEKQKQEEEKRKKEENEQKDEENKDAFEFWLKRKREKDRRKKIHEEEERKRNDKDDRQGDNSSERSENDEAFKGWLSEKNNQFKKEKLLKRRQDQEMHEGYYVRSRDDCEKAYKLWLKHKAVEARKARVTERTKAKLQRLAARRARKSINLSKSIKESQSFRYVDYYGYRF